jgi:hypothetical protein
MEKPLKACALRVIQLGKDLVELDDASFGCR